MKFGIIVFPGSNCDHDCYHAVKHVFGCEAEYIWHKSTELKGLDCIILPGGFSYGDYLRTGAIARSSPVMTEVVSFAKAGGAVLGICNGFQILAEAGLLPGVLMRNKALKFICGPAYLRVENNSTIFTNAYKAGEVISVPIAHADGNYYADADTIKRLEDANRVVLRYSTVDGQVTDDANPNGSLSNIAAIVNEAGNVMGTMPHPERACEADLGSTGGRGVFESLLKGLAGA
ncbi:MAG: phosphoribosylformylglycinamidine synthase I [Deltaproteobacteria bacterium RIFCSPLOWO2_02_FULL_53_8]|nr:MAG: phosphoribosylformylglycinamidine synthase I [Deltaproteobacteria bacterium RIFCSPLOWO2_02_FULL_53_8]